MTERRRIVIGVGNRDRGDDAVGPIVCDLIASRSSMSEPSAPGVAVWVVEGDPSTLAVRWRSDDRVVVIDAVVTDALPGTMHRLDPATLALGPVVSTHGIGVAETIALSTALGSRPLELSILGVEAASFDHGASLTRSVAAAVESVAECALDLLADPSKRSG